MKKLLLVVALLAAFLLGYGFRALDRPEKNQPRVTGIGGIFFKAKDPDALKKWYADYLGMQITPNGVVFAWRQRTDSTKMGLTVWTPFKETTKYFQPSDKPFMINYRVVGLDSLLARMKQHGILPADSIENTSYGRFVHVMDPEGNKIELWEPGDAG